MSANPKMLRLPPMPKISDLLRVYGLTAKKQLSQNFILDLNVTDKMARAADVFDCHVCEVGAGPGSFTRSLLYAGARHVAAVEIDKRFLPSLELLEDAAHGRLSVHHADIMKFDVPSAFPCVDRVQWNSPDLPGVRMVGNLPFSVSIPLLLQWLQAIPLRAGPFAFGRTPMSLVFQKEVGHNIVAGPRNSERSRLSVMTQHLCEVKKKLTLPCTVFTPQPKVDALLLQFVPRIEPLIDAPYPVVEQIVKAVFSKRRKFIRTPLKSLFPEREALVDQLLSLSGVDPGQRAHQLSMEDFNSLCRAYVALATAESLPLTPLPVRRPVQVADFEGESSSSLH